MSAFYGIVCTAMTTVVNSEPHVFLTNFFMNIINEHVYETL